MKVIILIWGASQRGKSECVKTLVRKLQFSSIIKPWNEDEYDSYVIGSIKKSPNGKERIIGLESQGDPGSNQLDWIEACVNENCEIIVAASRSYGWTYTEVYRIANEYGYEVIETTTHFHNGGPCLPNGLDLRNTFAENMMNMIYSCLD